jgi:hypothetical protein
MTDLLDLASASIVATALYWNAGSAYAPVMGAETALSLLRFGLRQTKNALAIFPASLFLQYFDALEPLQHVATRRDLVR